MNSGPLEDLNICPARQILFSVMFVFVLDLNPLIPPETALFTLGTLLPFSSFLMRWPRLCPATELRRLVVEGA